METDKLVRYFGSTAAWVRPHPPFGICQDDIHESHGKVGGHHLISSHLISSHLISSHHLITSSHHCILSGRRRGTLPLEVLQLCRCCPSLAAHFLQGPQTKKASDGHIVKSETTVKSELPNEVQQFWLEDVIQMTGLPTCVHVGTDVQCHHFQLAVWS